MKKVLFLLIPLIIGLLAHAETQLNKHTLQGRYHIKAKKIQMETDLVLEDDNAYMFFSNSNGFEKCKGRYKFEDENNVLITKFKKCVNRNITYYINLKNQTIESLSEISTVSIIISIQGEAPAQFLFSILKVQ